MLNVPLASWQGGENLVINALIDGSPVQSLKNKGDVICGRSSGADQLAEFWTSWSSWRGLGSRPIKKRKLQKSARKMTRALKKMVALLCVENGRRWMMFLRWKFAD